MVKYLGVYKLEQTPLDFYLGALPEVDESLEARISLERAYSLDEVRLGALRIALQKFVEAIGTD